MEALSFESEFEDSFGMAHHMVTEHLLVGDFPGLIKGSFDYFANNAQMFMFFYVFSVCHFFTFAATFWLNDEGVYFYKCY